MNTYADKKRDNKTKSVANAVSQNPGNDRADFQFLDNRPEAVAQRKLQEMANNNSRIKQMNGGSSTTTPTTPAKSETPYIDSVNAEMRREAAERQATIIAHEDAASARDLQASYAQKAESLGATASAPSMTGTESEEAVASTSQGWSEDVREASEHYAEIAERLEKVVEDTGSYSTQVLEDIIDRNTDDQKDISSGGGSIFSSLFK